MQGVINGAPRSISHEALEERSSNAKQEARLAWIDLSYCTLA